MGMRLLLSVLMSVTMLGLPAWANDRVPTSQIEINLTFAPLVKQAAPAVVNIYAKRIVQENVSPFQNDPFFSEFFRSYGTTRPRVQNSLGSGVILSADGIVVSNYHVVGQAQEIRVVLNDKREFSAKVLLADQGSDLAVLKLDNAVNMPFLTFRDSDTVEVGELVLAIGNPFGVGQTVTSGIVSGLARSGGGAGDGRGYFIQTDAPINPGNSGGALIDVNGELIGVNTSILSKSGGSNGIGFAIPASLVHQFVDQASIGNTTFKRPWAGLYGQELTAELAQSLGMEFATGLIILDLNDQSSFAHAGFRVGDVIVAVDGQAVNGPAEMYYRISVKGIGETILVDRLRDGKIDSVNVSLISAPDVPKSEIVKSNDRGILPGVTLRLINPMVQQDMGLSNNVAGIIVVDAGKVAPRIGLKSGDVIVSINGEKLENARDFDTFLALKTRPGEIIVNRDGAAVSLRFRL
jgi:Do/DeqQ family serine protease